MDHSVLVSSEGQHFFHSSIVVRLASPFPPATKTKKVVQRASVEQFGLEASGCCILAHYSRAATMLHLALLESQENFQSTDTPSSLSRLFLCQIPP